MLFFWFSGPEQFSFPISGSIIRAKDCRGSFGTEWSHPPRSGRHRILAAARGKQSVRPSITMNLSVSILTVNRETDAARARFSPVCDRACSIRLSVLTCRRLE